MDGYHDQASIVVKRYPSNKVQFLVSNPEDVTENPVVIAESSTYDIEGCFMELIEFIKGGIPQKTLFESDFNEWFAKTMGCYIVNDAFVFILDKRIPDCTYLYNETQKKLFWVSLIIQENDETKPWLCSKSSGFLTLEDAYKEIEFMREHDRVLSAWIDIYENDKTVTVFHKCYIDSLGNVLK